MLLHDGKARLSHARTQLQLKWHDAQAQWDDAVSRDFEREHLEPLVPALVSTLQAIDRLADIMQRCQQECR